MKCVELSEKLLEWFYQEKRNLPWRRESDPYRIWVSEIMLQQTKVDTVIPYYERFMKRFPNLSSLAAAEEEEVLKLWEGLGYYSRARNLHTAVKEVQEQYGGVVPSEEAEIEKLKGIGSYTKGAILSIAYQKPVPAVDGNVMRVISRIFNIDKDIAKPSTKAEIERLVREIIPSKDPSGFNQGLMEMGALVCTPRNPKCLLCPVLDLCEGREAGREHELPVKSTKEKKKDVPLITILPILEDKVLIHRRDENLLKGLWEFPTLEKGNLKLGSEEFNQRLRENVGIDVERFEFLGKINHIFSHLRWKMEVYIGYVSRIYQTSEQDRWITEFEMDQYPFPVPHQKIRQLWKKQKATTP